MKTLQFREYNKYELYNLLYLAKVEGVGYDELRESADSLTGDSDETLELVEFINSVALEDFIDELKEGWTAYRKARDLGFVTGWWYGITLRDILQLLHKYWIAEASRQELYEDAFLLTGDVKDKVVANGLVDYITDLNPDQFEDEKQRAWVGFLAEISETISFNSTTMRSLVEQDGLLLKMFKDLSKKIDEESALIVLFNSEVRGDSTYEELYYALGPNHAATETQHMGLIEAYAKAFKLVHEEGKCVFNPKEFGSAWDEIASGVIEALDGFKCDLKVFRSAEAVFVIVLD